MPCAVLSVQLVDAVLLDDDDEVELLLELDDELEELELVSEDDESEPPPHAANARAAVMHNASALYDPALNLCGGLIVGYPIQTIAGDYRSRLALPQPGGTSHATARANFS